MRTSQMIAATVALFALAGLGTPGLAQTACTNYSFHSSPVPAFSVPGSDTGSHCDETCIVSITFPFAVHLYGSTYTTANASPNGFLQFAGENETWVNQCLPASDVVGPTIFALWDDLRTDSFADSGIFTSVSGSAPSRVFQIEWRTGYWAFAGHTNFAIRFYEDQPKFDLLYGIVDRPSFATVGVQAGVDGPATMFACDSAGSLAGQMLTFTCAAPRFTYQGKLTQGGFPANGSFDMTFDFYRAPTGGAVLATKTVPDVQVNAGLFTVPLDVPALEFTDSSLFLEITVANHVLSPRQEITWAPKAGFALKADQAARALDADESNLAYRALGLSAPDGNPVDAVIVNNDGSVVVAGTLYANRIVIPPYTNWYTIPAGAFHAGNSDVRYVYLDSAQLVSLSVDTEVNFQAAVVVPHNVQITRLEFMGFDFANTDMVLRLERIPYDSPTPTPEILASVSSFGSLMEFRNFATGPLNIRVDNLNNAYAVCVHWHVPPASFQNIRLSNVRISYIVGESPE